MPMIKNISKRMQITIAICCCVAILIGCIGGGLYWLINSLTTDSESLSNQNYISMEEGFTGVKITDEQSALAAVASVSDSLGITDAEQELRISRVDTVGNDTYYRIQQYHQGLPVYGRNVIISANNTGTATALISNVVEPPSNADINPIVSQKDVEEAIKNHADARYVSISPLNDESLCIYSWGDDNWRIAYQVSVSTDQNLYHYIVDARNAEVLLSTPLLNANSAEVYSEDGEIKSTGWKNNDGSYSLYNEEYNISIFDLNGITTTTSTDLSGVKADFRDYGIDTIASDTNKFDKKAVTLLQMLIEVNQYYETLGNNGFDQIHAGINELDRGYTAWGGSATSSSMNCAVIALEKKTDPTYDLIAHEYTHAVSKALLKWVDIHEETGAINEGISDIFGELFEEYITGEADWIHGDRNLIDPSANNFPEKPDDKNNGGQDFSHGYSTVISHAAYLMWNGLEARFTNMRIGADLLGQLWYRAMLLMQPDATFGQCGNAVRLAAIQMVRSGDLTADQLECVMESLERVGIMNENSYPVVHAGAKLYVNGLNNDRYGDYHLTVQEFSDLREYLRNEKLGKTVISTDVSGIEGYALDLSPGKYVIRVRDNAEFGSEKEFTQIIQVADTGIRVPYFAAAKEVTLYTDFGQFAITDFIGMTVDQIAQLYGSDFQVIDNFDMVTPVIYYEDQRVPFRFIVDDAQNVQSTGRSYDMEIPSGDKRISGIQSVEVDKIPDDYTVDGVNRANITYGELYNREDGVCWTGVNKIFSYQVGTNIVVNFEYYTIPTDDSIAQYISVQSGNLDRTYEEDWTTMAAYQVVLDQYKESCSNNHVSDYQGMCPYCVFATCDIDGDGVDELIVQDGAGEQSRTHHIYTMEEGEAKLIGEYNAWHLVLYDGELGDGKLIGVSGMGGSWIQRQIVITGETLTEETVASSESGDNPFVSIPNPIEFSSLQFYTVI